MNMNMNSLLRSMRLCKPSYVGVHASQENTVHVCMIISKQVMFVHMQAIQLQVTVCMSTVK